MNWHISCVNSYMKLYIISNRLPVKVTKEDETFVFSRSEGGLATGLDSLQISYEKHWIGWPGICVDNEESKEEITFRLEGINFHPVFLSEIIMKAIVIVLFGHYVTTFLFIRCIGTLSGNRIRK